MLLPNNFSEITFAAYQRWQMACMQNAEISDIEQLEALTGESVTVFINEWLKKEKGYVANLFSGQSTSFAKASDSITVMLDSKTIELAKGDNLFDMSFGANQQIMELVDSLNKSIYEDQRYIDLEAAVKGMNYEEATPEQLAAITELSNTQVLKSLEILPDLYAWTLVSKANQAVTEENKNKALDVINNLLAHKIVPIFDAFFLSKLRFKLFQEPQQWFFLFIEQLTSCSCVSDKSILTKRILTRQP
jgi:hypothetical protein